ncbi:TraB/GumN family protein [Rhizobium sp. YIM 134829]|uniref:TraB/GumN family protein n=1 Tax=Rhizobium sp. YIM 134829 TaxID=3390453 RepID=UPI003978760E
MSEIAQLRLPAPPSLIDRLARLVLGLAALLPLVLLGLLSAALLSASLARAEEAGACAGENLLTRWQTSAPEKRAALDREAAKIVNGEGLLWRIDKPGVAPSYLLGTMHVTDPRVLAMPKGAAEAYDKAGTIIVESDEIADETKASAAMLSRPDLSMFTDGKSLDDFLSADDKATLEAGLKARGVPLGLVARMKPWMIAGFVALPACEMRRKQEGATFLDQTLAKRALAEGKRLKGLETLVEQLEAINALPISFHVASLVETIKLGSLADDVMTTTTDLYLQGRTGAVMPLMNQVALDQGQDDTADSVAFEQRIVTDRNHVMASRAAPILNEGNAFMAIGALHLPGEEGVVELLRKEGFSVTRVR